MRVMVEKIEMINDKKKLQNKKKMEKGGKFKKMVNG